MAQKDSLSLRALPLEPVSVSDPPVAQKDSPSLRAFLLESVPVSDPPVAQKDSLATDDTDIVKVKQTNCINSCNTDIIKVPCA